MIYFIVTFVLLSLCFAGLAIRILLLEDGQFRGSCSSQQQWANGDLSCIVCGKKGTDDCPNKEDV